MRHRIVLALAGLALTACGHSTLESTLDPVPEGELTFLVEDGTYDARFVTVSNTCSDVRLDYEYSTVVRGDLDGTPYLTFDGPGAGVGYSEHWGSHATQQIFENPSVGSASATYPEILDVEHAIWIERAGPGLLELRYETLHETCEHIGRLTLTLRD